MRHLIVRRDGVLDGRWHFEGTSIPLAAVARFARRWPNPEQRGALLRTSPLESLCATLRPQKHGPGRTSWPPPSRSAVTRASDAGAESGGGLTRMLPRSRATCAVAL